MNVRLNDNNLRTLELTDTPIVMYFRKVSLKKALKKRLDNHVLFTTGHHNLTYILDSEFGR